MTTTSIIHHKPPPLSRNDNSVVYLRTNNYYGSVGRPSHGRRKSAVELLQETKAFYVKSESVLDSKQEFKNAEHLHVTSSRSPTNMDHNPNHHAIHYNWEREGPPPSAPPALSPYATFSYGCGLPPYYHYHDQLNLDHLHLMHTNYLNSIKREKHHQHKREKNVSSHNTHSSSHPNHASHINQAPKVTAKITLIDGTNEDSWREYEKLERKSKSKSSSKRAAEAAALAAVAMQHPLPPIPHQLLAKEVASNSSGSGSAKSHSHAKNMGVGKEIPHGAQGPITFTSFSQNGSLYSSLEKRIISSKTGGVVTINQGKSRERKGPSESDSPPPLPPKSPRTNSKPNRPSDFPQRLVQVSPPMPLLIDPNTCSTILPPPPPRKNRTKSGNAEHNDSLLRRNHQNPCSEGIIQPMTLPSPILPPTPPPDSERDKCQMSDSGPIISPPPAFSTPVTPMLDRQNSGISSSSKSHNDDVSMRYSPLSRSRLSSSSPMSHQDAEISTSNSTPGGVVSRRTSGASVFSSTNASMGQTIPSISNSPSEEEESEDAISADVDGDDDDSSRAADENNSSMHHLQATSNSKLNRNNSKKSVQSADGTVGASSRRSPSRVASTVCRNNSNRVVSSSSPGKNNVTISLKSNGSGKLSKSITENFLCRSITSQPQNNPAEYVSPASKNHYMETSVNQTQTLQHTPKPRIVSPVRRPILRSKSDLSHRYMKASRSATLTPGFTLVHVDLGPPPPVPLHNSVSNSDFPSVNATSATSGKGPYQITPAAIYQASSTSGGNHYHQPHYSHNYHTLQPSNHYSYNHHTQVQQAHHIYARPSTCTKSHENVVQAVVKGKTELDRFFDQLGLENKISTEIQPLSLGSSLHPGYPTKGKEDRSNGSESPPVFFSSISSIDSCARKSGSGESEDSPLPQGKLAGPRNVGAPGISPPNVNGGNQQNNNNGPSIVVHHGEPSIVERNARVIKWLFNCRKAQDTTR